MADNMTRQEFTEYMTAFEQRFDTRFGRIDGRLDGLDASVADLKQGVADLKQGVADLNQGMADLKQRMAIQFEETRQNFKLSLEAVAGLREKTEEKFGEMSRDHALQKSLLESAIRDIGRSVRPAHSSEGHV